MQSITAHPRRKGLVAVSLIALCSFLLTPSFHEVGPLFSVLWFATNMMLFGSQLFWIGRALDLAERFIPGNLGAPGSVWQPQSSMCFSFWPTISLLSKCSSLDT